MFELNVLAQVNEFADGPIYGTQVWGWSELPIAARMVLLALLAGGCVVFLAMKFANRRRSSDV